MSDTQGMPRLIAMLAAERALSNFLLELICESVEDQALNDTARAAVNNFRKTAEEAPL